MSTGRMLVVGMVLGLTACSDGPDITGDGEAVSALRTAIEERYSDCSGKWTTKLGGRYHQIDSPSFTIHADDLDSAQKLNGILARARVKTGAAMSVRRFEGSGAPNSAVWTRWSPSTDGFTTLVMERRNDGWRFSGSSDLDLAGGRADCAMLPPG